jgi:diguanylate cyclase (GGDEF)-like protein
MVKRSGTVRRAPSASRIASADGAAALAPAPQLARIAFAPVVDLAMGRSIGWSVGARVAAGGAQESATSTTSAAETDDRRDGVARLMRERALEAIGRRRCEVQDDARWFIALDATTLLDTDAAALADELIEALEVNGGPPPAHVVLELGVDVGSAPPISTLTALRDRGFALGYAGVGDAGPSLATMATLRPDYVAIAPALIREIDRHTGRRAVVASLVACCEDLGIALVADDIESETELAALRALGVQLGRGPWLGEPSTRPRGIGRRATAAMLAAHGRALGQRARHGDALSATLLGLVEAIGTTASLEDALAHVTAFAAELLGVARVTVRLLDETRSRLLVAARTGVSVHKSAHTEFVVGEGLIGWVARERKSLRLDHAPDDPRFIPKPGQIRPVSSFVGVPILDEQGCIGVLAASTEERGAFGPDDERRLRLVAAIAAPRLQNARLRRLAMTDPLTRAWNRRALDELLGEHPREVSVVAADIDRFKTLNDRYGHPFGDEVLRTFVRTLASALRDSDHVVRVGGEEFLLLLHGAPHEAAMAVAERARRAVATQVAAHGVPVTASFGVATARDDDTRGALLARADAALYRAKAAGRDRVWSEGEGGPVG